MLEQLVVGLAIVGFVLLLFHSWKTWGPRRTLIFYALALVLMVLKERHGQVEGEYIVAMQGIWLAGVPVLLPVGWTFAFALSWHLAEPIVRRVRGANDLLFPTLSLAVVGVFFIAFAMETTGIAMGWWEWQISREIESPLRDGFRRIFGWGWHGLKFYLLVAIIECKQIRSVPLRYLLAPLPEFLLQSYENWMLPDRKWIGGVFPMILPVLAFVERLRLADPPRGTLAGGPQWAAALMIGVCLAAQVFVMGQPGTTLCLVPITVMTVVAWRCRVEDDAAD